MNYMLDTNILIYFMRNRPASVAERINRLLSSDGLFMSFVTYAELYKGVLGSANKDKAQSQLKVLASHIEVRYNLGVSICHHYAEQFAQLKAAGTPIGNNDLWIASHALADQMTLVTNITREFERIRGLVVENWVDSSG